MVWNTARLWFAVKQAFYPQVWRCAACVNTSSARVLARQWVGWRSRFALVLLVLPFVTLAAEDLLDPMPEAPKAPAFDLQTPDGARVALADLHGEIVLVNFWATWCPPCRAEMPAMERAWQGLRDKGVRFVAINVDEDKDTVAEFAESVGVSFPLLLDPGGKVTQSWPLRGLPTTFVVDANGHLRLIALGEREWDQPSIMQQILSLVDDFPQDAGTALVEEPATVEAMSVHERSQPAGALGADVMIGAEQKPDQQIDQKTDLMERESDSSPVSGVSADSAGGPQNRADW